MIKRATRMLWLVQLNPKREACRQLWWFKYIWRVGTHSHYIFKCRYKPSILIPFDVSRWHFQSDCWNSFQQQTKHISLVGCFIILVCFAFRSRWRTEWQNTTLSDEHGVSLRLRREEAGSPAGAAESSCWQRGRREVESVSELAGWHSYHGTNSLGTEETAANCGAAREETGRDWGNAEPAVRVPVPVRDPDPDSQSASMPSGTHRWFAPRWMWV